MSAEPTPVLIAVYGWEAADGEELVRRLADRPGVRLVTRPSLAQATAATLHRTAGIHEALSAQLPAEESARKPAVTIKARAVARATAEAGLRDYLEHSVEAGCEAVVVELVDEETATTLTDLDGPLVVHVLAHPAHTIANGAEPADGAEQWQAALRAALGASRHGGCRPIVLPYGPGPVSLPPALAEAVGTDALEMRASHAPTGGGLRGTAELDAIERCCAAASRAGVAVPDLVPDAGSRPAARRPPNDQPDAAAPDGTATDGTAPTDRRSVAVYEPQSTWSIGYVSAWRAILGSLRNHRSLVWQLFRRDFLATYRSSYLGLSWLFVAPLLGIVQWLVIQRNGVLDTATGEVPYAVYVLLGTTFWTAFLGFYQAAAMTLRSSANLLMQVRFPRESLIFKQAGGQAAMSVAAVAISLAALLVAGEPPAWQSIALPVVLVPMVLLATAVGLFAAMFTVVAVDLDRLLRVFWGLAMWLTPVVYVAGERTGALDTIARWNPLTHLVLEPRNLLIDGTIAQPGPFVVSALGALVLFVMAGRLYHVSEPQLVERLL